MALASARLRTLPASLCRVRMRRSSGGYYLRPPPPARAGPLSDITIVDLSRVLAGPYCTLLLRELGARVLKVETPHGGDDSRHFGPWLPSGDSAYFETLNAGKESIALDLKKEEDMCTLHSLLAKADVLVENYRPGVMDRMGLGWEEIHKKYPRLCYASISGFGQTGPDRMRSAYDCTVQGLGGIMSVTGSASRPDEPIRVGISIGDIGAGMYAALGVTAALHHRAREGVGCQVDVSMLDSQVALLLHQYTTYDVTGKEPKKLGSRHPTITPFQSYLAGTGESAEHIVIGAGNNKLFKIVAETLGHPEWVDDERFLTNGSRTDHFAELKELMEEALTQKPPGKWVDLLVERGVPSARILGIAEASAHRQIAARRMLVDHVCLGTDPESFEDGAKLAKAGYPGAELTTSNEHVGSPAEPRKLLRTAGNPIKMPGVLPDKLTRLRSPKLDEQGTILRQEFEQPHIEGGAEYAVEEARLQAEVARAVSQALSEKPKDPVARVAELLRGK